MNIAISGYTAAGKTTHARLIAQALGFEHVSAAEILLTKLGFDLTAVSESEIWFHHNAEIDRRRQGLSIDRELDTLLRRRAAAEDGIVFDARFLPWFAEAPLLRIWLASDLPSRARKCCVSVGMTAVGVPECAQRIHQKDNLDVGRLAGGYGCVFGPDRALFDVVLDNSSFIPAASAECAASGVRDFHPYLLAVVRAKAGDPAALRELRDRDAGVFSDVVRFIRR
jgi:cytidylate kinase